MDCAGFRGIIKLKFFLRSSYAAHEYAVERLVLIHHDPMLL